MKQFVLLTDSGRFEDHPGKTLRKTVTIQVGGHTVHGDSRANGIYELNDGHPAHDYFLFEADISIGRKRYSRFAQAADKYTAAHWRELARVARPFLCVMTQFDEGRATYEEILASMPLAIERTMLEAEQDVELLAKNLAEAQENLAKLVKRNRALNKFLGVSL